MPAKFKAEKSIDTNILFKKLKDISKIDKDNKVTFQGIEYETLEWIFLSLIDFSGLYSIESKKIILYRTFSNLIIENRFDIIFFYESLNNQIKHHNKKQETDYYFLTSLSIKELPVRRITIGDSQILITGKQFPRKFRNHRNNLFKINFEKIADNDYLKIVVKIKARDFKEGFEKAYQSLEVFRALLCLFLNSFFELRIDSNTINPINKIRQGQFSSLHLDNGTCANDYYWYEPTFIATKLLEFKLEKSGVIKTSIIGLVKKYNACSDKHKGSLTKALKMYVSAFDESNKYICFLRSWTALECILNTDQNDLVIKRCVALYDVDQKLFEKQILEALRIYRNEFVHQGEDALNPLVACFKIQELIFKLIFNFNFRFAGFLNTIEESTLFLDNYTPDLNELKKRKKILDKAIELKEKHKKVNSSTLK